MARLQLHPLVMPVWLAILIQFKPVSCWNRVQCLSVVNESLSSNDSSFAVLHPTWFYSVADSNNPILTLQGCEALCDSNMGIYSNSAPRLIAWFLPIVLLVVNMQFAPIGKKRFLMIVHLLGDPIHSTWSQLTKVEDWNRCVRVVQSWGKNEQAQKQTSRIKNTVMTLSAGEELTTDPCEFQAIVECLTRTDEVDHILLDTATALSESRSNEILRTLFAILLYVFQVIAAFVPSIGESANPSAGRIAPAMMYSWLLPDVLLSNAIGGYTSPRNCRRTILQFLERIKELPGQNKRCKDRISKLLERENQATYHFQPLAWSGAIYTYNPGKRYISASRRNLLLVLLAVLPVSFAFGTAFAVLETAPTYFSCRSILVIMVYISWLISAMATWLMSIQKAIVGRGLWYLILIKDTVIGVPILAIILATSCGMFNSCRCWSGAVGFADSNAQVPLNPTLAFNRNDNVIYPAMVATGLSLQICLFIAILRFGWPGFRAMGWF